MERSSIDYGEAEILVLVLEKKTGLVLLNEKEVREVAERLGFRVLGTVGGFTHRGKTRGIILFKVVY
jgi:predicted nucleic acid-binding protein